MTTAIHETINAGLSERGYGSYGSVAAPIADRLAERERGIYSQLVEAGQGLGASREQVVQVLDGAGLTAPVVAAVTSGTGSISMDEREELADIRNDASKLVERIDRVLG